MKKIGIFLGLVFFVCKAIVVLECLECADNNINNSFNYKLDSFDKRKYDALVKSILRYRYPSFTNRAAKTIFKELVYIGASVALGYGIVKVGDGRGLDTYPQAVLSAALAHTVMRLFFDYLLVSGDENLKNLENFDKYVKQVLSSDDALLCKESDLLLRLFEKDYDLILNKVDQDRGAGFMRRFVKWVFKHQIFILEATSSGLGSFLLGDNVGIGVGVGIAYYIGLIVLFDFILASKDQRLLKIEKLREIAGFIEEAKLKKEAISDKSVELRV